MKKRFRRQGQGMTEYIILVGVLALLLIAAVNKFAFAVDEAIQGSANAFILRTPADDYWSPGASPEDRSEKLGVATKNGSAVEVYARADNVGTAANPEIKWVKVVGSPGSNTIYNADTHGPITSGRAGPDE